MSQKFKTRADYPPGVWEDEDGALHFSLPEIMKHVGVPYTAENEKKMRQMFDEVLKAKLPQAQIVHQQNCSFCHGHHHKEECPNK